MITPKAMAKIQKALLNRKIDIESFKNIAVIIVASNVTITDYKKGRIILKHKP